MKKVISISVVLVLLVMSILTGCSGGNKEPVTNQKTITVTDHSGETVTLPADIQRVAVCDIFPLVSVLSVFLDSADKIVAIAPSSMAAAENGILSELYPEIKNADTSAIAADSVNVEELMKLDPQVVFYNTSNPQLGDTLKKAGFNAVAISVNKWDYNAVETLNQWINLLSQIFPEKANNCFELVSKYSEEAMALVKERTEKLTENEKKNIFFLLQYGEDSIVTTGLKSFGQWWSDAIGAKNAATELTDVNSGKITLEQVYKWNPDIVLVTNFTPYFPEDLYGNKVGSYDWSGIKAVQNKAVYKMPLGMYRSFTPGIDTPITLMWIAKTVYPELFEDIDITEKTVNYYKNIFGVDLTEKQAESIFVPLAEAGKTE